MELAQTGPIASFAGAVGFALSTPTAANQRLENSSRWTFVGAGLVHLAVKKTLAAFEHFRTPPSNTPHSEETEWKT